MQMCKMLHYMYIIHLIFYCLFNVISSSDYIVSNGMTNYTLVVKFQVLFRNSPCQTKSYKKSLARLAKLQVKILIMHHSNMQYECYLLDHI